MVMQFTLISNRHIELHMFKCGGSNLFAYSQEYLTLESFETGIMIEEV